MSRPVYSTCFLALQNTPGTTVWGVPPGDVAILKHMSFWSRDAHPASITGDAFTVALDVVGINVWTIQGEALHAATYQWSGWEVFTAGLYFYAQDFAWSWRASGTLLTPT